MRNITEVRMPDKNLWAKKNLEPEVAKACIAKKTLESKAKVVSCSDGECLPITFDKYSGVAVPGTEVPVAVTRLATQTTNSTSGTLTTGNQKFKKTKKQKND